MSYSRFAIYGIPPEGALADFGAAWLGWDVQRGRVAEQTLLPGLHDITMTPRKYGFHGTLKPPFRLADSHDFEGLARATSRLATSLTPATCEGLDLTALGGFLALTPRGDVAALRDIANACVRELDPFRAPAPESELTRRRKAGLSPRQEALLVEWGYPYVMDEFRFHMTLSGRLPKEELAIWGEAVRRHMPDMPEPFVVDQIALCGEREDGRFELIHRYALSG